MVKDLEVGEDKAGEAKGGEDKAAMSLEDKLMALVEELSPEGKQRVLQRLSSSPDVKETKPVITSTFGYAAEPSTMYKEVPKLPFFSGLKDKDTSFGRWKFEVKSLWKGGEVQGQALLSTMRRSLKSPAADALIHLGDAGFVEIMDKLESLYGTVMSGDTLLTKFFSEPQQDGEDCAQWSTRLEHLCYSAAEKDAVDIESLPKMLAARYWAGLRDGKIKEALRPSREDLKMDQLVVEARKLEEEFGSMGKEDKKDKKKPAVQAQAQQDGLTTRMDELMKTMESMAQSFQHHTRHPSSNSNSSNSSSTKTRDTTCFQCKEDGHLSFGCRQGSNIECFKCKRKGHISSCCRNKLN